MSRNHAAGLPLFREEITRCRDCKFYDHIIHACSRIDNAAHANISLVYDEDFCCWAVWLPDNEYTVRYGFPRDIEDRTPRTNALGFFGNMHHSTPEEQEAYEKMLDKLADKEHVKLADLFGIWKEENDDRDD